MCAGYAAENAPLAMLGGVVALTVNVRRPLFPKHQSPMYVVVDGRSIQVKDEAFRKTWLFSLLKPSCKVMYWSEENANACSEKLVTAVKYRISSNVVIWVLFLNTVPMAFHRNKIPSQQQHYNIY